MDPFKRLRGALRDAREGVADLVLGYQIAPESERAAIAGALAFGAVVLVKASPAAAEIRPDSLGRSSRARRGVAGSLMLAAGVTAVLNRDDGREARYAAPFGVGAALALDGAPPGVGLAGVAGTALGLGGLVRDLHRRGAVHRAIRQLAVG